MGRADLIGNGKRYLVPAYQPIGTGRGHEGKRKPGHGTTPFRTQHTGLPDGPHPKGAARSAWRRRAPKPAR
jgi:hypothetical protein